MTLGAGTLILQTSEAILLEVVNDVMHMLMRQLQTTGYRAFIPTLCMHSDDCPTGLVGIFKFMKMSELKLELNWDRMTFQKAYNGVVIGLVTKFAFDDPHNLPIMDRW